MSIRPFEHIRELLTESLGREPREPIWEFCVRQFHGLLRAVEKDPEQLERLWSLYLDLEETFCPAHTEQMRARRAPQTLPADGRLMALQRIASLHARKDPFVTGFRQRHFESQLLPAELVGDWLRQQEAKHASLPESCHLRIPLCDLPLMLKQGLLSSPQNGSDEQAYTQRLRYWRDRARKYGSQTPNAIYWDRERSASYLRAVADEILNGERDVPAYAWHDEMLRFADEIADPGGFVWTGNQGPLVELKNLSRHLRQWIPWSEAEVVVFVLTDAPPTMSRASLEASVSSIPALSRLRLIADPRIPPRMVAQLYERGRGEFSKGKDSRMGEKFLKLAVFGAEQLGSKEPWQQRRESWNQRHPKWRYDLDPDGSSRKFARDTRASYERVVGRSWTKDNDLAAKGLPIFGGWNPIPLINVGPVEERRLTEEGTIDRLQPEHAIWLMEEVTDDEGAS